MTWHAHPTAQSLLRALFDLSAIGRGLDKIADPKLTPSCPGDRIGHLFQDRVTDFWGIGRRDPLVWKTVGGTACQHVFEALSEVRDHWMAEQAAGDEDRALELYCDTPTVSDAIDAFVREMRAIERRAA